MDVWITMGRKPATCKICNELIEPRTPYVKGKMWRKAGVSGPVILRKPYTFRWHILCWIASGIEYTITHPREEKPSTGRRKLQITPEQAKQRRKLIMKRADLQFKCRDLSERLVDCPEEAAHIKTKIEAKQAMMNDIEDSLVSIGGVPKSWMRQ